jgi:hypothetical protein
MTGCSYLSQKPAHQKQRISSCLIFYVHCFHCVSRLVASRRERPRSLTYKEIGSAEFHQKSNGLVVGEIEIRQAEPGYHCPFLAALYPTAFASFSLMYFPCLVLPYHRLPDSGRFRSLCSTQTCRFSDTWAIRGPVAVWAARGWSVGPKRTRRPAKSNGRSFIAMQRTDYRDLTQHRGEGCWSPVSSVDWRG